MKTRLLIGLLLAMFCPMVLAEKDEFSLNLKDVDIRALIETVADVTGKNFIIDPRITGNISVVTSTPMKSAQVYDVFLSILKVHGYSAIPNGNVVKIIPNVTAKQDGEESELRGNSQNGDEQLTRVLQVHHVDAAQLVQTLLPLMPQYAFIGAVPESNTVILSDTAANVKRLAAMIKQIDKSDLQNIEIINLRHANAADLIQPLNTLMTSNNAGKTTAVPPPMVADERSNSIILGGDPEMRLQMRALIANLDTPIEKAGNTEVIYMRYAVAKELVETLTGVGSLKDEKADQAKTKATTAKDFDIRADEAANALIITAPHDLMLTLKSVVRQLDVRRAQVHIEAIIAEVSYDKSQNIGVEWQTKDDGSVFAASRKGEGNSLNLSQFITSAGKGLSIGYLAGSELKALLTAFASDTDVNVLSTPSLVTMDNEEASMIVGRNIPLTTGQYTPSVGGSLSTPFQTIQREDIGIKLKVLPQINEGNAVKLKVAQEVSSVVQGTTGADLQTNKRKIETSVLVDDGKVLVLGGLIEDDITETVDKVPLLGDIPYLGYLFQTNSTTITKKNLMVFLRPQIIRDAGKSSGLTHDKYNYIRDKQQEFNEDGVLLMPEQKQPLLDNLADDNAAAQDNGEASGNGQR
ncbi:type II secretion system secretin GspD [Methylomonas fluvii]|uniref:Type II secretion system secretin GspD n=1 Tax=Methylomonas fluvii TaxID=1854564 RepID=A0ABR9DFT0_9GAMM|nr:type II secretion system secretin GspD [Methylomonas fluvii]MBD9361119.1 type II secretion system secretin GspD [Methylomonas fluvii]CAD6874023.1 General secretion pathway protein D [Methylomonas fluvii]